MAIVVLCPACRTRLTLGDERAGETFECPRCEAPVTVPSPYSPPPSRPLPPPVPLPFPPPVPADAGDVPPPPPGKVTAVGGMLIGGGAWAIFANLFSIAIFPLWCFWPGLYFGIVWAIFAIIRGAGLLGDRWRELYPRTTVILQVVQAVNLDAVNVAMGIIGLVFLNDRGVRSSFRRRSW